MSFYYRQPEQEARTGPVEQTPSGGDISFRFCDEVSGLLESGDWLTPFLALAHRAVNGQGTHVTVVIPQGQAGQMILDQLWGYGIRPFDQQEIDGGDKGCVLAFCVSPEQVRYTHNLLKRWGYYVGKARGRR